MSLAFIGTRLGSSIRGRTHLRGWLAGMREPWAVRKESWAGPQEQEEKEPPGEWGRYMDNGLSLCQGTKCRNSP